MSDFGKTMTDRIVRELDGTFKGCEKRVRVWADVDKYHWKEDESVWEQKRGKADKNYEAHFDGEFICFMEEGRGEQEAWKEFISKFRDLYKLGKIFVNTQMYEVIAAQQKAVEEAQKVVSIPTPRTEGEAMVAEVLVKQAKKRGRKPKLQ